MHVMIDLETLGVVPGCSILSIGAVGFDDTGLADGYHAICNVAQGAYGLHIDPSTEAWWAKQSPEARATLDAANKLDAPDLADGLRGLNDYIMQVGGPDAKVWGNGADFDNAILAVAYRATCIKPGWKPYNGRCYRTIKNLFPSLKIERQGTYHNALDDAISQAEHLRKIAALGVITLG